MGDLTWADVFAIPGSGVRKLVYELQQSRRLVDGKYKYVIILVGTNDFGGKREWKRYNELRRNGEHNYYMSNYTSDADDMPFSIFQALYEQLITYIRSVSPSTLILCSSILPRPWDFDRRDGKRRQYNAIIQRSCNKVDALFLTTYTAFFKKYSPRWDYFSTDGLHLSRKGQEALKSYLADKLFKARKGLIH